MTGWRAPAGLTYLFASIGRTKGRCCPTHSQVLIIILSLTFKSSFLGVAAEPPPPFLPCHFIDFIYLRVYNRVMYKNLSLPTLKCLRCGHSWYPKKPVLPKVCPKCKSPYWNKPKWKGIKK